MGSETQVSFPQPTAQETALQQEQLGLLREQRLALGEQAATQDLLAPFLFRQLGLNPTISTAVDPQVAERLQALPGLIAQAEAGWHAVPLEGGDNQRRAFEAQMTALRNEQQQLQAQAQQQSGGRITGFTELPPSQAALREQQMQDLLFQRSQAAFEQEQADRPLLARQRDLEASFMQRTLADLEDQAAGRTANKEIEGLLRERTLAALKGELPVNPALSRELVEGEESLRAQLSKQLGPGFETSTPGIQALAEFDKRKSEILEGARRGDLQLSEQLNFAREAGRSQRVGEVFPALAAKLGRAGQTADIVGSGLAGIQLGAGLREQTLASILGLARAPLATSGLQQNLLQGFNAPLSFLSSQRQNEFQANAFNAQQAGARQAGYGQLFGTLAMAAALA